MELLRGAWSDFSRSYDVAKVLSVCDPKSLLGGLVAMFVLIVVPAFIPPLARHGSIDAHWHAFGLFAAGVACSYGFHRTGGRSAISPVLTAADTLLAESALSLTVVTTTGHVRYAYAVLQGLVLIAAHSRYYALSWVYAGVLALPLLGLVGTAVAFFGVEHETLLVSACMYMFALWVANLTRMERAAASRTAQLKDALIATDTVANRSMELALTRTALTVGHTLHEMRNQLCVLGAGLEYLSETMDDDPERRAALNDSTDGYRKTAAILDGAIGKLKRSKDQLESAFDACRVLGDFAARSELPGLRVRFESAADGFVVRGDEEDFRAVIANLARNAAKAGAHEVRLVAALEGSGKSIRIEVRDDGIGIDERVARELFNPFVSGRQAEGGTGLGLYLSRRQIELMGGTIEVCSTSHDGTCFAITLPGKRESSSTGQTASAGSSPA